MADNQNLYFMIIIALLGYIIYMMMNKPKQEGFLSLDDVTVLPSCANLTADTLLKAFDFDIDRLSGVLVSLEINPNILKDKSVYPKLASLLIQKGLLREDKCME